jgi:hypothetical protein
MTDKDEHLTHLRDSVVRLGSASRRLPDRSLLIAGGVLLPLGFGLIGIGWYGSAQTTLEFEQTPFLISGGVLGLALVVLGGLLYFSYWLTRLVRDGREQATRTAEHQARLEGLLTDLAAGLAVKGKAEALVVTPEGSMLHRPGCAATDGQAVRKAGPAALGLALCGLCRPEAPDRAGGSSRPAPVRRSRA